MANKSKVQSVEPDIADLVNGWLKSYGLDYKLEQASLNSEIDKALDEYHSKSGGKGGNRPDAKLLLKDKYGTFYPVLIEYKGYKDKLVKLDTDGIVDNKKDKNEPNYTNIKSYAVNGAIHYANAILHYTSYTRIIAIGVTGYKDEFGKLQHEIGVYYVSADKNNLGFGQRVGDYTDLSFLKPSHFDEFVEKLNELSLTQAEIDKLKEKREKEINISLVKLNNDIYKEETGLGENDRIYLVAATIIATLGAEGVKPLEKSDLGSSTESGETDGDKIIRKITSFLKKKQLPQQKQDLIIRTLSNTLVDENRNKPEDGESQIKRVFSKIVDDLGIYYKIGITTDFTGMLFNEMYNWLGFTQDKLNDVVLTPSYVARLLVKLARVDKDSYVWDFATGSAGLLVAAMNEMIDDATADELSALDKFNSINWKKFNLETLFGKSTRGKRLKGDDRIGGNLPFVTAGETDEGISAFISNDVEIFSSNTTTIDMFGSAKYRNYNYGADDHIAVVHTENLSKYAAIFVTSACHKSAHNGDFSYSRNFYAKDADKLYISLPVKNEQPDYELMSTLISAMQKLVIADVVKFSDEKIKATKQVVG